VHLHMHKAYTEEKALAVSCNKKIKGVEVKY